MRRTKETHFNFSQEIPMVSGCKEFTGEDLSK